MDDPDGLAGHLLAFTAVVEAGGFTAASRSSRIPVSRLSRRVAALEKMLGVSLLMRDSRHFQVTRLGERLARHGLDIRAATKEALALARDSLDEPSGPLRVSCPMVLASLVAPLAIDFARRHPKLNLSMDSTDGRPLPPTHQADLVIQPSASGLRDSEMVARKLVTFRHVLVATPRLLHQLGNHTRPAQLANAPAIGWSVLQHPGRWRLLHATHAAVELHVQPRFTSDNLYQILVAVKSGLGIAMLPPIMCTPELEAGTLVRVLPGWFPPPITMYAIYRSRKALSLAGRLFLNELIGKTRLLDTGP